MLVSNQMQEYVAVRKEVHPYAKFSILSKFSNPT